MKPATQRPARPLARGRARASLRLVAGSLAAVAIVAGLPGTAAAALQIEATYALGGLVRPGAPAALSVTVTSDRILAADLVVRVSTEQGPLVVSTPVEVPGGSRKRFLVVVPAAAVDDVRLVSKNKVIGSTVPTRAGESTTEIVGVVVPTDKETVSLEHVRLEPVARDADVVPVPQDLLDLGAGALGPLTHLVVDATLAPGLSPRQRETVLAFAANGGELVVAAAAENDLAFLPAAWRGSGGGSVRRTVTGAGVTTVALAAFGSSSWGEKGAMWTRTIRPYGRVAVSTQPFEGSQWLSALAETGGLSASRVAWLLTFVLAYVAIAGPLNFLVLARLRRRELAWVTVPILSVLFAAGAYGAGRGVRSGPVLQAAGIAVYDAGFDRTATSFGVMSRGGGIERLRLGGDWILAPLSSPDFFGPFRASLPKLSPGRDHATASFDLPVGGVGTAIARRTRMRGSQQTAGTLTWDGTSFSGNVTNPAPYTLQSARVFVGADRIDAGTLEPGEQAKVTITPGQPLPFDGSMDFFGFTRDGRPAVSGSLISLAGSYAGLGQQGHAYLAGFAELSDAAAALGLPRGEGRVLVLARLNTTVPAGKPIPAPVVRRSLLTTDLNMFEEGPGMMMLQAARDAVFRFELPAGGTGGSLRLNIPAEAGGFFGGKAIPGPDGVIIQKFGARGGSFTIQTEVGSGAAPVIVPPRPPRAAPDIAAQVPGLQPPTVSLWDFAAARWVRMTVKDNAVEISGGSRGRFLNEGQLLARIKFDVPDRSFRIASFTLQEVP